MRAMYGDVHDAFEYMLRYLNRRAVTVHNLAYIYVYFETVLDMLLGRLPQLQHFAVAMDEAFAPVDAALAIVRAHNECKYYLD